MNNQKKARKEALQLCVDTFGDRLYKGNRSVWMIVFDDTQHEHLCVLQKVPDEMGRDLQDISTSARAISSVSKGEDSAELLSFLCLRPEYSD